MKRSVCIIAAVVAAYSGFAQVPQAINYQGRLINGTNLYNGTVGLTLSLYATAGGGIALYADSNTVTVVDGLYSTVIGDGTISGTLTGALASGTAYLEATVNGTALLPREKINSVAYALNALSVPASGLGVPLDNVIWVATNGSVVGPGTVLQPFDTPQRGYNAAAARFPGLPSAIAIASGTYTGSLNMTAGSVHVFGVSRPQLNTLNVVAPASGIAGKQRVENIVCTGAVTVSPVGGDVKFHNVRMQHACTVQGSRVEFQDCFIVTGAGDLMALSIVPPPFPGFVAEIGIYQTAIENNDPLSAALAIDPFNAQAAMNVRDFEMIGCEVVNKQGLTGPAIYDNSMSGIAGQSVHLFAHNFIKGPKPGAGSPAVADSASAGPYLPYIGFYNNTVFGDVGNSGGNPTPMHAQFFGNNMVHGKINAVAMPPSAVGWLQAGAGTGADAANNTEHETGYPVLPDSWND